MELDFYRLDSFVAAFHINIPDSVRARPAVARIIVGAVLPASGRAEFVAGMSGILVGVGVGVLVGVGVFLATVGVGVVVGGACVGVGVLVGVGVVAEGVDSNAGSSSAARTVKVLVIV